MFHSELKKSGKKGQLTLGGALTFENVEELKITLEKALGSFKNLTLCFRDVEEADFTFIQLLCAAHKSACTKKKILTREALPPELEEVTGLLGFTRGNGCFPEDKSDCLWRESPPGQ